MRITSLLMAACLAATVSVAIPAATATGPAAMAGDQARDEADRVRNHLRAGEVKSLREIEQHVLPKMRGMQYLGPEYDARDQVYRLKFLKEGRVYFVYVDATTGRILKTR